MKIQISIQAWDGKATGVGSALIVSPYGTEKAVRVELLNALVNMLPLAYDKALGELIKCQE